MEIIKEYFMENQKSINFMREMHILNIKIYIKICVNIKCGKRCKYL